MLVYTLTPARKPACRSHNIGVSFIGQVSCHLVMTGSDIPLYPMQSLRRHALPNRAGNTFYTLTPFGLRFDWDTDWVNVTGSNLLCKQHIVLNHVF